MLPGDLVAAAYRDACLAELAALKPGNVHVFAAGHDMTTADFERSAQASAAAIGDPALSVGGRILEAVRRTRAVVGCNTNLGIVLLCAPLGQAALSMSGGKLRDRLRLVLERLDRADAEHAFAAIRLAEPGGLGTASSHDVHAPATVSLRVAMAAARERDRIALQYVTDFADIFDLGLPRLRAASRRWGSEAWAASSTYLTFLAAFPDSHVARRHGLPRAMELCRSAGDLNARLRDAADPSALTPDLLACDAQLKAGGINPGTSADLTVASLFALRLQDAEIDLADRGSL